MKFTRQALLAATVFIAACLQDTARANTIEYTFFATIDSIFIHDHATLSNTFVSSGSLASYNAALGQNVIGTVAYDSMEPPSLFDSNGSSDGFLLFNAGRHFSVTNFAAGLLFNSVSGPASNVVLMDGSSSPSGWDGFFQFGESVDSNGTFLSAQLSLQDSSGIALGGFALPNQLNLGDFAFRQLHFAFVEAGTGDQLHFYATLGSLEQVNSVSDTGTTFAMLGGVVAILVMLRRLLVG